MSPAHTPYDVSQSAPSIGCQLQPGSRTSFLSPFHFSRSLFPLCFLYVCYYSVAPHCSFSPERLHRCSTTTASAPLYQLCATCTSQQDLTYSPFNNAYLFNPYLPFRYHFLFLPSKVVSPPPRLRASKPRAPCGLPLRIRRRASTWRWSWRPTAR